MAYFLSMFEINSMFRKFIFMNKNFCSGKIHDDFILFRASASLTSLGFPWTNHSAEGRSQPTGGYVDSRGGELRRVDQFISAGENSPHLP